MKKISIGSWAYTIGPYADKPVDRLRHEEKLDADCADCAEKYSQGLTLTLWIFENWV